MTAPRIVVKGATLALSRRTNCRKAFLAPWHPQVEACWLYALADGQRKHRVAVHHGVRVVSHHHLSVTLEQPNLGAFLRDFHHDTSRSLNTLLARERYDAPGDLFDGRPTHVMRLLDPSSQAQHLVYEHLNPVAAGLVSRPQQMPGRVLEFGHWKSGGLVVKRPEVYFGNERPSELWLELTPPPLLYEAFDGDLEGLVQHMGQLSKEGGRALREARTRPPLGAQRLRRMHPWQEPRTLAAAVGQVVPSFKVGSRDRRGQETRALAALETTGFRLQHAEARQRFREGEHGVLFPHGTYEMRVAFDAKVAEPDAEAIVCQPGPLLSEVKAALEARAPAREAREQRKRQQREMFAALGEAWKEEAESLSEAVDLDFARGDSERSERGERAPSESRAVRPQPEERHVSDRDPPSKATPHARRLIIKRDRRRGRPSGRWSQAPPD